MFLESTKEQTHHDPIAEQKARTIEAIVAILPPKIKRPNYNYQRGGGNRDICWVDGHNNFRRKFIELLPKIIAEVEKHKVEEIRKIITEIYKPDYYSFYVLSTPTKTGHEDRTGFNGHWNIVLTIEEIPEQLREAHQFRAHYSDDRITKILSKLS